MDKARIGIIGVGMIGKKHLETYEKIEGVEVVAIADINEAEAQSVSQRFRIPHVYTNFRELLQRDDIVAVDVCLHNNFHAPATIAALEAGKHVYCEKPIAGSYADGKAMVEAAKQAGKMLHIQLADLFTRETQAAKGIIDEGGLGRIFHARSTGFRRRGRPYVDGYGAPAFVRKATAGGGALFDMGVYHISQLLYLMGLPKVARVTGKVYQETEMDEVRRAESGYDVEEIGVGFVRFEDGATMDIIEAWAAHMSGFEGSSLLGSKGGIRFNPFSYHTRIAGQDVDITTEKARGWGEGYQSSHHHWIAVLQRQVELMPTAETALLTMLIQEGIYLSDREGRELSAEEVAALSKSTAIPI